MATVLSFPYSFLALLISLFLTMRAKIEDFFFEQKLMDFLLRHCCFALHFKWNSNETELWMFITLIPLVPPGCLLACMCGNVCTRELTWYLANTSQITLCCLMDCKWSRNNRLWNTSGADRVKKVKEESRRLFRFCSLSLISIKLHYYIWKVPQILWVSSLTDRLLEAEYEVQSSGNQMLWLSRKLFLPPERKCVHSSLQSTVLECSHKTKLSKPGLFTTVSSCVWHQENVFVTCSLQVFLPKEILQLYCRPSDS